MMADIRITISAASPVKKEEEEDQDEDEPIAEVEIISDQPSEQSLTASTVQTVVTLPESSVQLQCPNFELRQWNPLRGVEFMGLVAFTQDYPQTEHLCKMKVSTARRRVRRRELLSGQGGRNVLDEKKLHQAAAMNDKDTVMDLLQSGIDPCAFDSKQRTALHIGASKGHERIVTILLNHGANPNQQDCIGNTPLHLAVCSNNVPVVSLLLAAGTDVLSVDAAGRTPMHLAQSRIYLIKRELKSSSSTDAVKDQVIQVTDMMNKYLRVRGDKEGLGQLTELCDKLQLSATVEEISSINDLLEEFTSLNIQKESSGSAAR